MIAETNNFSIHSEKDQNLQSLSKDTKFRILQNLSKEDFQFIQNIGTGSQGNVYLAKNVHSSQMYAIKTIQIPKSNFRSQRYKKRIQTQIKINIDIQSFQSSDTRYFPKFYCYFKQNITYYLIFQLCQKTSIQGFKKLKTYQQKYIYCFILLHDMVQALSILEKRQIIHRDIKPQNIMVQNGYFKLGDLGLAKQSFGQKKLTMDVGNIFSKSPEFYAGQYNSKSDVWGLAVTIFYLLENKLPFDQNTIQMLVNQDKIDQYIERMKNNEFFIQILSQNSAELKKYNQIFSLHEILQHMLIPEVQKRLLASQIKQNYFQCTPLSSLNTQSAINQIISLKGRKNSVSLNPINANLLSICQHLLMKYLFHRQSYLGIIYMGVLSCIKQITKINRKLVKLNKIRQMNELRKQKKNSFEGQVLKSVKQMCFKLIQWCSGYLKEKQQNMRSQDTWVPQTQITSFGEIQQRNHGGLSLFEKDQNQLISFLQSILQKNNQLQSQNNQKQQILLKKYFEQLSLQKASHKQPKMFQQISQNIQVSFQQILLTQQKQAQKPFLIKQKSRKYIQHTLNSIKQKLPKSLRYISEMKENNQLQNLDKYLQVFDDKLKLKQKFPLIEKIIKLLKKVTCQMKDQKQISNFIVNDFKIWDLPLELFRI